ncbi:SpoIIE family protein phosphatase [Streptomyces sp. NPDC046977]|uniref:SpoIIE family protein phosphatase n=1 Tax=Streptomyces sp. NPDC046977 TaxID=3154703 RepID=UPI0033D9B66D
MSPVHRDDVRTTTGMGPLVGLFGRLGRDLDASVGMLYVLPPGERVLQLLAMSGTSRRIAAPWVRVGLADAAPVAEAVRERRLVWVNSPTELARRFPRVGLMVPYDILLAAAPITTEEGVWGAICMVWPIWHPPQLSAGERETSATFCRRAGRLLEQAARRGEPLLPGAEPMVLPAVRTSTPDPAEALAAYDFAERLPTGCASLDLDGRITFLNSAAAELLGQHTSDLLGTRPWERLPWLDDPTFEDRYRAAVISRQPTAFIAWRPPDRRLSFHFYPASNGISVRIAPVTEAKVMEERAAPPRGQGPMGASTLYQLMHLAATLSEAVGVRDVVDQVADQLVPAFEAEGLALLTAEEGRLHVAAHRGYTTEFMARFEGVPLSAATPPTQALATGTPRFFTSFGDFQRAYPEAPRYGDRDAWAFLPLIASGRPIGLLTLSYDRARPFPLAERAILTSLAGLIAQALDRAHLYDATRHLARTLQTGLLPQDLPEVPGLEVAARYRPSGHGQDTGGDFYDLIHCGSTCAALAIGDVQGHNVQAAALMGQVRTAVHAHATAHTSPSRTLTRTNRLLTDLNAGLFTSCLYAHLDLGRHRARLATAGHPPPLIRHPDGRAEVLRMPPGLLLGVAPDGEYPMTRIPLSAGTVLVLYTDGLVEAPGVDIERSTTDLLRYLAPAGDRSLDDLADTLVDHALRTTPGNDDIALLIARVTG